MRAVFFLFIDIYRFKTQSKKREKSEREKPPETRSRVLHVLACPPALERAVARQLVCRLTASPCIHLTTAHARELQLYTVLSNSHKMCV